jgi:hypothetical protein
MIQAKYDKDPGITFNVAVNDRGMQQGVHANYWLGAKRYPNGYWADFTLTPDGKKVVKLLDGGSVIQWRPDGPAAPNYSIVVVPLAVSHLKARSPGDVETIGDSRTVTYMEDVTLDTMPAPLQAIAQIQAISSARSAWQPLRWSMEPGACNRFSRATAEFVIIAALAEGGNLYQSDAKCRRLEFPR